jgi:hypothetical protein
MLYYMECSSVLPDIKIVVSTVPAGMDIMYISHVRDIKMFNQADFQIFDLVGNFFLIFI